MRDLPKTHFLSEFSTRLLNKMTPYYLCITLSATCERKYIRELDKKLQSLYVKNPRTLSEWSLIARRERIMSEVRENHAQACVELVENLVQDKEKKIPKKRFAQNLTEWQYNHLQAGFDEKWLKKMEPGIQFQFYVKENE